MVDDGSARGFCHPLDPFLKYLSDFHSSDEMATRIEEAFNHFDYNNNGCVDFLEELCGDDYKLSSDQFFQFMLKQVTLYVRRVSSKTPVPIGSETEAECK